MTATPSTNTQLSPVKFSAEKIQTVLFILAVLIGIGAGATRHWRILEITTAGAQFHGNAFSGDSNKFTRTLKSGEQFPVLGADSTNDYYRYIVSDSGSLGYVSFDPGKMSERRSPVNRFLSLGAALLLTIGFLTAPKRYLAAVVCFTALIAIYVGPHALDYFSSTETTGRILLSRPSILYAEKFHIRPLAHLRKGTEATLLRRFYAKDSEYYFVELNDGRRGFIDPEDSASK